ncbi:DUF222 domain-containing protein [Sinomonas flava]|uniref:HNH endonuclease signature motif containing protein n=1 Tax=Sinomonas flava TaxID=496857 RepID=UPI0039A5BE98
MDGFGGISEGAAHDGEWLASRSGASLEEPLRPGFESPRLSGWADADDWSDPSLAAEVSEGADYPAYLDDPAADPDRELSEQRDWAAVDENGMGEVVLLHPLAVAARNHQRAVDALLSSLSAVEAAEAKLHAMRVLMVRGIANLLGADAASPFDRLDAPSLAAAEIAAELSLPPRAARALVAEALAVTEPEAVPVLAALQEGRLDRARAQTILHTAAPVPAASAPEFLERALALAAPGDACPDQPADAPAPPKLSLPALRRSLRRMAEEHSALTLSARAKQSRERRRVDIEPGDDGMCHLHAHLPLEAGAMIDSRLQAIARSQASPDDPRTVAQRRVDAFTDLLLAPACAPAGSGAVRAEVVVKVPHTTVLPTPVGNPASSQPQHSARPEAELEAAGMAFGDEPAEVLGYGLIPAEAARALAAQSATWLRLLTDPQTGAPLALGRTRYTPPAALRRFLALRDHGCRFPACDRPHPHTEADHTHEWSTGGSTDVENLGLLCPEHHRIKTLGHWRAQQNERDGTIVWTSPLGRRHITRASQAPSPPRKPPPDRPPPF